MALTLHPLRVQRQIIVTFQERCQACGGRAWPGMPGCGPTWPCIIGAFWPHMWPCIAGAGPAPGPPCGPPGGTPGPPGPGAPGGVACALTIIAFTAVTE